MTTSIRRHLLLALLGAGSLVSLLGPTTASAALGSAGTDFWLGLPAIDQGGMAPQFVLELTATAHISGTVSVPGGGFSQSFAVSPGSKTDVVVPLSVEDTSNDAVSTGQGVHVTASGPVAVDAMYEDSGLSDGYLGLATGLLGKSYVVAAVPGDGACGKSQFEIVGTQNATTVSITPSSPIAAHASGTTYMEQLDAGSTYLGQTSGTDDLTGSVITSDKPVAVLAGNSCAQVPAGTSFANALMEEEPPVTEWGTQFFTLPFATRTGGDEYTILTSQPNTTVSRNGSLLATIVSAHGAITQSISSASHITASRPILLLHLAKGGFGTDGTGDPTMIVVPPASMYTRIQTVGTPAGFAHNYLNITIASSDIATLTLDGQHVAANMFHAVGDSTTESGAQIPVSAGAHTLVAAGPLGVEAYGFVPNPTFDAYGFPGALGAPTRAAPPQITLRTPSNGATYRAGQTVRAAYSCAAATGTTIRSCAGPVANGALIPTSTPGSHSFTVRATDFYGGHSTRTVAYRVAQPSNRITVVSQRADPATGDETVTVRLPGPGALRGVETASKPRLVVARVQLTARKAGRFKLIFKPSAKARAVLRRKHTLAVKITLTFTPTDGRPGTKTLQATIRLR